MASEVFYAVRKGFEPGIYRTWKECQAQVVHFKGQDYQKFKTLEEAQAYMGGKCEVKTASPKEKSMVGLGPILTEDAQTAAESFEALLKDKSLPLIEEQEFTCMEERPLKLPKDLIIYTDGSCFNAEAINERQGKNTVLGPGGYSVLILDKEQKELMRLSGGEPEITNQRMELMAIKEALQYCNDGEKHNIKIVSDSKYAKGCITDWYPAWINNKKTVTTLDETRLMVSDGSKPVDNQDVIKDIMLLKKNNTVEFCWVKGHANNKFNNICDEMAKDESKRQKTLIGARYRETMRRREEELSSILGKKEPVRVRPARNTPGLSR